MKFSHLFKANPYRDAFGRFATANSSRGIVSASNPLNEAQVAKRLEKLVSSGVSVEVSAKDWMQFTEGKLDPVETVQKMWGKDSLSQGLMTTTVKISDETGVLSVEGTGTMHGKKILWNEWQIDLPNKQVDLAYIKLLEGDGSSGVVKDMFRETVPLWQRAGAETLSLHANLDAGGHAWGRYGFRTDDPQFYKRGYDDGWTSIVKKYRELKQEGQQLSKESRTELEHLREMLDRHQNSEDVAVVMSGVRTPHLDAQLASTYKALTPATPDHVQRTFTKTAMYEQHWYGHVRLNNPVHMSSVEKYLMSK